MQCFGWASSSSVQRSISLRSCLKRKGKALKPTRKFSGKAAESGAELIVCAGQDMEVPLYELQNNYPTISYLMIDGEPHSEDYASYSTASNAHCVLFS